MWVAHCHACFGLNSLRLFIESRLAENVTVRRSIIFPNDRFSIRIWHAKGGHFRTNSDKFRQKCRLSSSDNVDQSSLCLLIIPYFHIMYATRFECEERYSFHCLKKSVVKLGTHHWWRALQRIRNSRRNSFIHSLRLCKADKQLKSCQMLIAEAAQRAAQQATLSV